MSRARLIVAALGALLALPGVASAAELVAITGTVRNVDGAPAAGVEVLVGVAGSDIVQPVTTDATGAFAAQVEASPGDTVNIRATGPTTRTEPDDEGCVTARTPIGEASLVVGETPPEPVEVALDTVLESKVCTATATPRPKPRVTPPSTDVRVGRDSATPGVGTEALLLVLAAVVAGAAVAGRRRA